MFYFTGTAGDSLDYHNGMKFTTQDVDNDLNEGVRWSHSNCAQERRGAWWFKDCSNVHLNGAYLRGHHDQERKGICWYRFKGRSYSYKVTEMKLWPDKI
jgi:ficolin